MFTLELLQNDPATRYCDGGVIAIDEVLIGQACRAVETLATTLRWAMLQITGNSQAPRHVIAQLEMT